jgi:hypothetical protein
MRTYLPIFRRRRTAGASDAYALSPADLANIPWHNGAGAWGAQVPLQIAERPVTTRSVTVHNLANLSTEANTPGTEVTLGTSVAENDIVFVDADNIDIVIPSGIIGPAVYLETGRHHLRVRGSVEGTRSGGRVAFVYCELNNSDVLVDGLDLNGTYGNVTIGGEGIVNFRVNNCLRFGAYRCRAISNAINTLGQAQHFVIKSTNMVHGAWTRAQVIAASGGMVPNGEGWGIRDSGGPITLIDSEIRGTRYVNMRVHAVTGSTQQLLYVARTKFVAYAEGRFMSIWTHTETPQGPGQGAVIENCKMYGHTVCAFPEMTMVNTVQPCLYSRVRNNQVFVSEDATYDQAYFDNEEARAGDHDWSNGNTFAPWSPLVDPAYDMNSSGDPTLVPMPGLVYPVSYGEGLCTPPSF